MPRTITCALALAAVMCLLGCEASLQGARREFESTCALPARVIQGADRVPVSLPTPAATVRDLGTGQVQAIGQGIQKHGEEVFRDMH